MLSRLLRKTSKLSQPILRYSFASTSTGGNLYTWGHGAAGLGSEYAAGSTENLQPRLQEVFNNNVAKVAMGPSHSAVVTTEGDLYTFGYCHHGVLGHGEQNVSRYEPTLVEYFAENGIRIKDVAVGRSHTVALADNGDVYTWGFGGKSINPFANWFNPRYGALGLGSNEDRLVPALVEELDGGNRTNLTAGNDFVALSSGEEIYNWGVATRGVLATASGRHLKSPLLNEAIQHLREHDGIKVVKIKAAGDSILALFDDGSLYGWGDNDLGQLGVKKEVGVELVGEHIYEPTKVVDENFKGQKIVDFDIGKELSVILTDKGNVYWSGLKLALEPEQLTLPEGLKVKKVAAVSPSVAVLTENNEVYTNSELVPDSKYDTATGLYRITADVFEGGQILDVGGQYENRYAIVRN